MRSALLARLKRLETVRAVEQSHRPFKIEFVYLKLPPREYNGPRHRVRVGQRPDGQDEYEEWPGEPPRNHVEDQGPNVLRLYLAGAPESGNESIARQSPRAPYPRAHHPRRGV